MKKFLLTFLFLFAYGIANCQDLTYTPFFRDDISSNYNANYSGSIYTQAVNDSNYQNKIQNRLKAAGAVKDCIALIPNEYNEYDNDSKLQVDVHVFFKDNCARSWGFIEPIQKKFYSFTNSLEGIEIKETRLVDKEMAQNFPYFVLFKIRGKLDVLCFLPNLNIVKVPFETIEDYH